jgi:hypothetical protein
MTKYLHEHTRAPHPGDFGLPEDQWQAAADFAEHKRLWLAGALNKVESTKTNLVNPLDVEAPFPFRAEVITDEGSYTVEYTGGSVSYYQVRIGNPTSGGDAYTAECNDIIEALGMNYAEGNAFKAIWRRCAARTLGKAKAGYKDGLYDAEKVVFFGQRMVAQEKRHG